MSEGIINKVAESGLVTLDLGDYYPVEEVKIFDLREFLFRGLILKEKEFRDSLKNMDWEAFRNKNVGIVCSADAIIPPWAYMLVAASLQPVAASVMMGDEKHVISTLLLKRIGEIAPENFADQRVVIKGCGEKQIDESAYLEITRLLVPVAKTIMYGEPCSTVPVFKRKG